jgi:hypothetical protein
MTAPSQLVKRLKKALARRAVPHMYQRDGETIAFARLDLAVSGTGSSSVAPVVDKAAANRTADDFGDIQLRVMRVKEVSLRDRDSPCCREQKDG